MNRVVKAAVAVTAFGLAAALAVPAQAEVQYNTVRNVPVGALGGGTGDGGPLGMITGLLGGGLLGGGLLGGGLLGGGLLGGAQGKSAQDPKAAGGEDGKSAQGAGIHSTRDPREADIADENQRAAASMLTPNGAEDVTRDSGPMPELSPILSMLSGIGGGGGGLAKSLPLLGGARMAQPSVKAVPQNHTELTGENGPVRGVVGAMSGLVDHSVGGAMGRLGSGSLLPGAGSGFADTSGTTTATMNGTTKGLRDLSADTTVSGLAQAARMALPHATSGELAPAVGRVAPVEMAPVAEALPGATQVASVDDIAPFMQDAGGFVAANGTKAAGSYSDVMTALGWTTDALTSSVRDSWVRD